MNKDLPKLGANGFVAGSRFRRLLLPPVLFVGSVWTLPSGAKGAGEDSSNQRGISGAFASLVHSDSVVSKVALTILDDSLSADQVLVFFSPFGGNTGPPLTLVEESAGRMTFERDTSRETSEAPALWTLTLQWAQGQEDKGRLIDHQRVIWEPTNWSWSMGNVEKHHADVSKVGAAGEPKSPLDLRSLEWTELSKRRDALKKKGESNTADFYNIQNEINRKLGKTTYYDPETGMKHSRRPPDLTVPVRGEAGRTPNFRRERSSRPDALSLQSLMNGQPPNGRLVRGSLGGELYVFAPIIAGDEYFIGFTREQALSSYLGSRGLAAPATTPEKKPAKISLNETFYMQERELTNGQFLPFLRSDAAGEIPAPLGLEPYLSKEVTLPKSLGDLPVTGVTYLTARAFCRWLQARVDRIGSGWSVRLPHELEWEIAARYDRRRWPVGDHWPSGLATNGKKTPTRLNCYDRSAHGVWEMAAGVRELTATGYSQKLVYLLAVMAGSLEFDGWNPSDPYGSMGELMPALPSGDVGSVNMCVRGGGNGEDPRLMQVSVRRQQEWATTADDVGFRVILVEEAK